VPTIPVGRGPPAERAVIHNVHIYDNQNPHQRIGGLHLTNGVTKVLFYHMVGILIRVTPPWSLRDESIENSRERRTRYWRVIILSSHEVSLPFYLLLFRREEVANR